MPSLTPSKGCDAKSLTELQPQRYYQICYTSICFWITALFLIFGKLQTTTPLLNLQSPIKPSSSHSHLHRLLCKASCLSSGWFNDGGLIGQWDWLRFPAELCTIFHYTACRRSARSSSAPGWLVADHCKPYSHFLRTRGGNLLKKNGNDFVRHCGRFCESRRAPQCCDL